MRARLPIALAASLAIAAAGCGGAATQAPAPAGGASAINADLSEWKISLNATEGKAGTITFTIKNNGEETHEFVVVKTDLAADALPVVDDKVSEDAVTAVDEVENIQPGSTATLELTDLAAGHYVALCNLLAHYGKGMHAEFTVK